MNRSKRQLTQKTQKKMSKEVRSAQGSSPLLESIQYGDEQTAKELLKKYPKSDAKKKTEILKASAQKISLKKNINHKLCSKRTTPGLVPSDSPPASIHPEGKRWIKTLIKQNLSERVIADHKGVRNGRKK